MNRVLIVAASENELKHIVRLVRSFGFVSISKASSGGEVRRKISTENFELIVIKTPLSDEFGHELAASVAYSSDAGVILICGNDVAENIAESLSDSGVCIASGRLCRETMSNAMKRLEASRTRMLGPRRENGSLMQKIEEMRLINRAKCTLMQYLKFTEPQAHKYIEKQAMNTRKTRREVAQKILAAYKQ